VAGALICACRGSKDGAPPPARSAAPAQTPALAEIRRAEQLRDVSLLPEDALSARDTAVRVAAARALARIADRAAHDALLPALADEAPDVIAFAAFGLARGESGREGELTPALVLRAASLLGDTDRTLAARALPLIADALGRLGTSDAERTLRAWLALERPIAEAAALALGRVAGKRGALEETTFVALLDAAAPSGARLESALYAFTRQRPPEGRITERLLEIASAALAGTETERRFAVRALGRLGEAGAPALGGALSGTTAPPAELAEMARELARGESAGQTALGAALLARAARGATPDLAVSPGESDVLLAILDALQSRSDRVLPALQLLARMPLPQPARERARAVELRCAAARLLAGTGTANADLRACDPDPAGTTGKLAVLFVLDRGKLTDARGRRYLELARDPDARVRQAALRLIPAHRELEASAELFTNALGDRAPGVVATAAELLAKHPDRARPADGVVAALTRALRAAEKTENVEVHAALIDAAAALAVLGLTPEIERACKSDNPTLREHAERALAAASGDPRCVPDQPRATPAAPALRPTKLVFETDAGAFWIALDPELAPLASARLAELAKSGFFAGIRVHRSVPGFVVQLGDPGGDGYGGAPLPPLRCELAPAPLSPFEPGAVGIALSGRDTGNSQFFVTFGRFPHLDGEYTRVGRAGPGWERLRSGDRVHRVRIE
jgi:cyclophilin family peptidyl-prolyl cis-trans isomerase